MSRLFRRAISTYPAAAASGPSRTSTLPLAVQRRRAEHPAAQRSSPLTDPSKFLGPNAEPFPPQHEDEFQKLRARDLFQGEENEARAAFLATAQAWRSRVRGVDGRMRKDTGVVIPKAKFAFFAESEAKRTGTPLPKSEDHDEWIDAVPGTKVFLPNIQIRLMRNATPEGQAYDPFKATFRIPPGMTKNDLRSYLSAVYGLEVTFIRTDIYIAPVERFQGGQLKHAKGSQKNYKRAVVGLKEPFHYPDDVEEMRAGQWGDQEASKNQVAEREEILNGEFALEQAAEYRKKLAMKMHKGWRWRSVTHDNAGNTIREIMRRRAEREALIAEHVEKEAAEAAAA